MRVAGIDQGTTSTKGLIVDGQTLTPLPAMPHEQRFPQPGWVEHDATELLSNVRTCIEAAAARGVRVIGLANQGETVLAWDRDSGQPLGPAIVWQDQRTSDAVGALAQAGKAEAIARISGLPLDCYFSASKLRWLLDHADRARELARRGRLGLGTSDSYFIERLTGRYATDPTTASRTSLMNLATCQWDPELCELFGVPIDALPEIADDAEPFGDIDTGDGTLTLAASAVDQVAALFGHGCRAARDGKVTIGTGAFALMVTGANRPAQLPPGSIPTAAWRTGNCRTYAVDGGVYAAASAADWLARLGIAEPIDAIDPKAPSAAGRGLMFVPALAGLAFPHWDRSAAGLFIGIDAATDRGDFARAVLEGVAFRVAELLDGLGFSRDAAIPVDGGLARSRYFTQFLAAISGRTLRLRADAEITSLGIAQLAAAAAAGRDPDAVAAFEFDDETTVEPMLDDQARLALRARFADAVERSKGWRR